MGSKDIQSFMLARNLCIRFPKCKEYFNKHVLDKDNEETVESFNKKMINKMKEDNNVFNCS